MNLPIRHLIAGIALLVGALMIVEGVVMALEKRATHQVAARPPIDRAND